MSHGPKVNFSLTIAGGELCATAIDQPIRVTGTSYAALRRRVDTAVRDHFGETRAVAIYIGARPRVVTPAAGRADGAAVAPFAGLPGVASVSTDHS